MTTAKEQLLDLINHLTEEQIPVALELLQPLAPNETTASADASDKEEGLHLFLKILAVTFTNTLYDLSTEAQRTGSKVLSNRLEFSRKKIFDAWQVYNQYLMEKNEKKKQPTRLP